MIPEAEEDKAGKLDKEEKDSGPLGRCEGTRARRPNINVIRQEWVSQQSCKRQVISRTRREEKGLSNL
jgi:hypothetical protein